MRITTGKVVGGQVVVEGDFLSEAATVTIFVSDERAFSISNEDESALIESIAEANRGDLVECRRRSQEAFINPGLFRRRQPTGCSLAIDAPQVFRP
jgi:hypothetical protein